MKRKAADEDGGTTKRRNSRFADPPPAPVVPGLPTAIPGFGVGFMQSDVMQRARRAIEVQHAIQQQILTVSTIITNTKSSLVRGPNWKSFLW
jgi:hypothetical protein